MWRDGLVPLLSRGELEALRRALAADDPRLIQGATTQPPPLMCVRDWEVEGACLIGVCGWLGPRKLATVGHAEEFFARMCFEIDQRLQEPAACRWLLNWYDETPRDEMRRLLLPEVELALRGSDKAAADDAAGRE